MHWSASTEPLIPQLRISTVFPLLVAALAGCGNNLCSLPFEDEFAPRELSIAISNVEEIVPLAQNEFVVTARVHPTATMVTRVGGSEQESIAAAPALSPYDLSRSLFRTARGWWFSRQGKQGVLSRVFFIVNDGTRRQSQVNLGRQDRAVWMPIEGEEPRGVYVSIAEEQRALRATEVRPTGMRLLATFPWQEQPGPKRSLWNSRWSAEALRDGRIAIVSTEPIDEESPLTLRVVGAGEPVETKISCAVAIDHPIDSAVDASNNLAIVGLSKTREVVAMIIDVDRPQSARCSIISASSELAARQPFGTPSVAWTGDAFVVGWIGENERVLGCELGDLGRPPLIVEVGTGAELDRPLRRLIHQDADSVTFIWSARGGHFMQRRMPKNVSGYALAVELRRRLCGDS